MFGYSTALRSVTQGRATFAMEFSHFSVQKATPGVLARPPLSVPYARGLVS